VASPADRVMRAKQMGVAPRSSGDNSTRNLKNAGDHIRARPSGPGWRQHLYGPQRKSCRQRLESI